MKYKVLEIAFFDTTEYEFDTLDDANSFIEKNLFSWVRSFEVDAIPYFYENKKRFSKIEGDDGRYCKWKKMWVL